MARWERLCTTAHLAALGLWAGVLAMTAAAAAVTFPTLKTIDPLVPSLDAGSRPHWMYVGGRIVANVFLISHAAQAVCAVLALASVVCLVRSRKPGAPRRLPATLYCTSCAAGLLGVYLLWLWPRMRTNLHTYWSQLSIGAVDRARAAQAAFDADHPRASTLLQILLVIVLAALITGAWRATRPGPKA
ncbi:MAG TPA: hypothetical protein VEB22_10515 [Phycisphaerales bacterium]|nr:hypothetical protein [Phycisphaerales bacterium]